MKEIGAKMFDCLFWFARFGGAHQTVAHSEVANQRQPEPETERRLLITDPCFFRKYRRAVPRGTARFFGKMKSNCPCLPISEKKYAGKPATL